MMLQKHSPMVVPPRGFFAAKGIATCRVIATMGLQGYGGEDTRRTLQ